MSLTKLIKQLKEKNPILNHTELETVINLFSESISEGLKKGCYIEIRGLGRWYLRELKENFKALVGQFRSGKQEIYELTDNRYSKHYERAFRELFADTGYQATVGESERLGTGSKKTKKLYVTLPECFGS